jgi:hypothetical protein
VVFERDAGQDRALVAARHALRVEQPPAEVVDDVAEGLVELVG